MKSIKMKGMFRSILMFCLLGLSQVGFSQRGDSLLLKIVDQKVCYNRKTTVLSFSYYFENLAKKSQVVLNSYEACLGEMARHETDTTRTFGLVLEILDSAGNIVQPIVKLDTGAATKYLTDSTEYLENYETYRTKDLRFFTRSIHKTNQLYNLFYIKANRKKCAFVAHYDFDLTKKYTLRLKYVAREDVSNIANSNFYERGDNFYVGTLYSNQVPLCFK